MIDAHSGFPTDASGYMHHQVRPAAGGMCSVMCRRVLCCSGAQPCSMGISDEQGEEAGWALDVRGPQPADAPLSAPATRSPIRRQPSRRHPRSTPAASLVLAATSPPTSTLRARTRRRSSSRTLSGGQVLLWLGGWVGGSMDG